LTVGHPEHPRPGRGLRPAAADVRPDFGEGADEERLPRPGRRGEHLNRRTRGQDAAQRGGLVRAQLSTRTGEPVDHLLRLLLRPSRGTAPDRGRP
jgi:hypothetical protein